MHSPLASVRQLRDFGFSGPPVSAGGRTKPDLTSWDWYWKLDDGSGTTVANLGTKSGVGGTLTQHVSSLPTWTTDADLGGTCIQFGPTSGNRNSIMSPSYPANWRPNTIMSLLIAVKASELGGSGKYPPLITMGDYIMSSNRNGWYFFLDTNGSGFTASTCNGASLQTTHSVSHATAGISANVAYLIGWVKNGTSSKIYVNGVQVGSTGSAQNTIGYEGTERNMLGYWSDPTVWTDPNPVYDAYELFGKVGYAAGIASDQSANMLSIAQAAGFA